MSMGLNIALILALALAAIGSSTRYQADVNNSFPAVRGQNLNHNETLVRDTTLVQRADDWWLSGEQSFAAAPLLTPFLFYRAGAGCSPWVCGANRNETRLCKNKNLSFSPTFRLGFQRNKGNRNHFNGFPASATPHTP